MADAWDEAVFIAEQREAAERTEAWRRARIKQASAREAADRKRREIEALMRAPS